MQSILIALAIALVFLLLFAWLGEFASRNSARLSDGGWGKTGLAGHRSGYSP